MRRGIMSKKYHNPIVKVSSVTIPNWEYRALVRADAMLDMVGKLVVNMESYDSKRVLDVLFKDEAKEDE